MMRYTGKALQVNFAPRIDRQAHQILAFSFFLSLEGCNHIECRPEGMSARVLLTEGDDAEALRATIVDGLMRYAAGTVNVEQVDAEELS